MQVEIEEDHKTERYASVVSVRQEFSNTNISDQTVRSIFTQEEHNDFVRFQHLQKKLLISSEEDLT